MKQTEWCIGWNSLTQTEAQDAGLPPTSPRPPRIIWIALDKQKRLWGRLPAKLCRLDAMPLTTEAPNNETCLVTRGQKNQENLFAMQGNSSQEMASCAETRESGRNSCEMGFSRAGAVLPNGRKTPAQPWAPLCLWQVAFWEEHTYTDLLKPEMITWARSLEWASNYLKSNSII